jgi:membrane-associated phospholipid phosphatase
VQDFGGGTGLFRAGYAVVSKQVGEFDLTAGYGNHRIDGLFGGARWSPQKLPGWSLVAEYDAYDYKQDYGAEQSGAATYKKSPAAGVEYRSSWWGAKLFGAHGEVGANVYVSFPLNEREFVPKVDEPAPYTKINPRPTEAQWRSDPEHGRRLARALVAQDFRDISLGYTPGGRLEARLTNVRISSMPRAIGRAARTILSFAPLETREIKVTYNQGTLPIATYTFTDTRLLLRYFNGLASREMLAPTVQIEYARPLEAREEKDRAETLAAFEEPLPESVVFDRTSADLFALRGENVLGGRFRLRPYAAAYLNDPSGAFKYELALIASYDRPLPFEQTFLTTAVQATVYENVSDVTQASNSELPHVRSDIAEYKRASNFKLMKLLVNKFYQPAPRVYARASAGIYEEMFGGVGGQVLYLPTDGSWGVDVAVDALAQRDFEGWFGFQDYRTVTAIASLNYRMAQGVTGTLRAGRFLAKDEGVRMEIKRRFESGWEVGAWYTVTNGNDITSPGTPDRPYYDKGIFMAMPLETMLTRDTQSMAGFAIAPWTRDVGQMVVSPGDLYSILERPVLQMHMRDGLARFGDRDDDYDLPRLGVPYERRWPDFVAQDAYSSGHAAKGYDWMRTFLVGTGMTLASAPFDQNAFEYADKHKDDGWLKTTVKVGDALPVAAVALSGIFAFDDSRPRLSGAGVAALEAGAVSLVAVEGLKWGVGRARPTTGLGNNEFQPGSGKDDFQSFPSRHTAVMWAAVTPYAKEYDMPWLYGLAAVTNVARVGSREHWVSDTVAGSVIGYVLGDLAWQAGRESRKAKGAPSLAVGPGQVYLAWELQ